MDNKTKLKKDSNHFVSDGYNLESIKIEGIRLVDILGNTGVKFEPYKTYGEKVYQGGKLFIKIFSHSHSLFAESHFILLFGKLISKIVNSFNCESNEDVDIKFAKDTITGSNEISNRDGSILKFSDLQIPNFPSTEYLNLLQIPTYDKIIECNRRKVANSMKLNLNLSPQI